MRPQFTLLFVLAAAVLVLAQTAPPTPPPAAKQAENYSATYSFLQEGEFLQLTVEDEGKVTGFISRFGDEDNNKGTFLDHFFKEGKLDGKKLSFKTQVVHGVAYEFNGNIERGEGKTAGEEAYYVLKGTLVETTTGADKQTTSKTREVAFKSFPQDLGGAPEKPN